MSYEGYGIRARKDLTANTRPAEHDHTRPLHASELDRAARFLNGLVEQARQRGSSHVFVPTRGAARLVDALFLAAQALEGDQHGT